MGERADGEKRWGGRGTGGRKTARRRGKKLTRNPNNATVRPNITPLADDNVGHRRVHDHAAPVDKRRPANVQAHAVVDIHRRLDKRRRGLERWVGERLVVRDGRQPAVAGAVAAGADDARGEVSQIVSDAVILVSNLLEPLPAADLRVRVVGGAVEFAARLCAAVARGTKVLVARREDDVGEVLGVGLVAHAGEGARAAHGQGLVSSGVSEAGRGDGGSGCCSGRGQVVGAAGAGRCGSGADLDRGGPVCLASLTCRMTRRSGGGWMYRKRGMLGSYRTLNTPQGRAGSRCQSKPWVGWP